MLYSFATTMLSSFYFPMLATQISKKSVRTCDKCVRQYRNDYKYCPYCGAVLTIGAIACQYAEYEKIEIDKS